MLTKLEVTERAHRIWPGTSIVVVKARKTNWGIIVNGEPHYLNKNGATICHPICAEYEKQLGSKIARWPFMIWLPKAFWIYYSRFCSDGGHRRVVKESNNRILVELDQEAFLWLSDAAEQEIITGCPGTIRQGAKRTLAILDLYKWETPSQ